MSRGVRALVGVGSLVAGLAACAASAPAYQRDAQLFLTSDEVFAAYNINFTDPACTEPESTKVGETYTCTALGDNGLVYDFTLQITGKNKISLIAIAPVYPPPTTRASTTTSTAARPTTTVAPTTSAVATTAAATTTVAPTTTAAATTTVAPTTTVARTTTVTPTTAAAATTTTAT